MFERAARPIARPLPTRGWRRKSFLIPSLLLIISLAATLSVAAQDSPGVRVTGDNCSLADNKAFERRPIGEHQITTRFIVKPDTSAGSVEIKRHLIFSHILGKIASTELYRSTLKQCTFGTELDPSLDLYFELFSIGRNVHNECSLSRCARLLSDLLQTTVLDRPAFSTAIDSIAEEMRRFDSPDPARPRLGIERAIREAYRHIYPPDTNERILFALSPEDFLGIAFDDFFAWFARQQDALRHAADRKGSPLSRPLPESSLSTPEIANADCAASPDLNVRELDIDHHGWGQNSIILVNHAYKRGGVGGIDNPVLRAICHPNDAKPDALSVLPGSEMGGRVACIRQRLNRDRWLILFSKQEPALASADMRRLAQTIAQALKADRCTHQELRIFAAKFLPQR